MSLDRVLKPKLIIKRLLKDHISPHKTKVMIAIFFMVISALCSAMIVWLVKPLTDKVFITHDRQMLLSIPIAIFVVHTIKGIAEYFQHYIIKYVGQQILTNLQMRMYEHLLHSDLLFIQSQSSGKLISRFTNDIVLMRGAVSNMFVGCAKHFLSVVLLTIMMFILDPYLASFVFLAFPLAIYPVQKLGRRMRKVTSNAQEELSEFTSHLDEAFLSIKVIKSFCAEQIEANKAKKVTNKILDFYKKSAKLDSLTSPIMEILSGLAVAGLVGYGGLAIIDGRMTMGALLAFITAFVSAYRPFKSLVALNVSLQEGLSAANRVFNILDLQPTIRNVENPITPKFLAPKIKFDKISLRFNKKIAIKSLNLTIDSGKTYAFVGRSGSGKTTIANLLSRFFDPTSGQITIDNKNVKDISLKHLRQNIAMVAQDTLLFDATIAENIAYGCPNKSRKDIIEAAIAADAHEFIENLPQAYDTVIGIAGSTLSGGQRQRLSIARAFIKNAPILLLDEATSSLDSRSEQLIINTLSNLRKGRTTLIITHRLSTVVNVDQIVVMKHGSIAEQGTHQELLYIKGEYYKLYNKELKKQH